MPSFYPAFLDLRGRDCLVVGGGPVAARKVAALLDAEAAVRVVSPDLAPGLADLVATGRIHWIRRVFQTGDAAGAFLVIAATGDEAVNRSVASAAKLAGCLLNVVDTPELCNFIAPAIVRRGLLTVAISTGGRSPALARRVREDLEAILPNELAEHLVELTELRAFLRRRLPTPAAREDVWRDLLAGDLPALLRSGDRAAARALTEATADRWTAAERAP